MLANDIRSEFHEKYKNLFLYVKRQIFIPKNHIVKILIHTNDAVEQSKTYTVHTINTNTPNEI